MIAIATPTYDLSGHRIFTRAENSEFKQVSRRGTRTKTLDGGISIYDGGYSDGDRTLNIVQYNPTEADYNFCKYIVQYYSEVVVSCVEGIFLCWPQTTNIKNNELTFTLLVKEKLNG